LELEFLKKIFMQTQLNIIKIKSTFKQNKYALIILRFEALLVYKQDMLIPGTRIYGTIYANSPQILHRIIEGEP
jgi:hypothetical protein